MKLNLVDVAENGGIQSPTQTIATLLSATRWVRLVTLLNMLGVGGSSLRTVRFEPTTSERMAKRTKHVAANNVAICRIEMMRSFGQLLGA